MNFFDVLDMKAGTGRCCVRFCRRASGTDSRFCRRCRDRRYKALRPTSYAYNKLKNNARRRGKEFTITRDEWEDFCTKHDFIARAGKTGDGLTVDRRDPSQGYHIWNIQPLTNSANVAKGNHERASNLTARTDMDEGQPF